MRGLRARLELDAHRRVEFSRQGTRTCDRGAWCVVRGAFTWAGLRPVALGRSVERPIATWIGVVVGRSAVAPVAVVTAFCRAAGGHVDRGGGGSFGGRCADVAGAANTAEHIREGRKCIRAGPLEGSGPDAVRHTACGSPISGSSLKAHRCGWCPPGVGITPTPGRYQFWNAATYRCMNAAVA